MNKRVIISVSLCSLALACAMIYMVYIQPKKRVPQNPFHLAQNYKQPESLIRIDDDSKVYPDDFIGKDVEFIGRIVFRGNDVSLRDESRECVDNKRFEFILTNWGRFLEGQPVRIVGNVVKGRDEIAEAIKEYGGIPGGLSLRVDYLLTIKSIELLDSNQIKPEPEGNDNSDQEIVLEPKHEPKYGEKAPPLKVNEKGEQLIAALVTKNQPPEIVFGIPFFPMDFDWQEYARVTAVIKELEANAEEVWPSIVEHMTDSEYCYTPLSKNSEADNQTRGVVCRLIAERWLRQSYDYSTMSASIFHNGAFLPPNATGNLQNWCRANFDKKLYELQIESAEWAMYTIYEKSDKYLSVKSKAIADIRDHIDAIRKTQKPLKGYYFHDQEYSPYSKEEADRIRNNTEGMKF